MTEKILVVDDSASDRLIIETMLADYNVVSAKDGVEALERIQADSDIDLMILDLNMPNMNGFQVLQHPVVRKRRPRMRTIILTNYDELENEIKGLHLGAVDYVRKPIHMESLLARLEIHMELWRTQRELEQQLREKGLTFGLIFSQAPVGIAISFGSDPQEETASPYFDVNPMYEKITGRTKAELQGLGWAQLTHPEDLPEDLENYRRLQAGEISQYEMDKRLIKPDGSVVWVHIVMASLHLASDHEYNHICLVQDITRRRQIEAELRESERSKSVLLAHLPGMTYRCRCDSDWTLQFVSAGCLRLTGYPPETLINDQMTHLHHLIMDPYRLTRLERWQECLENKASFEYEYEITTADGNRKWVLELGEGLYAADGSAEAVEGIIIDITDRKTMENRLKYDLEHDRTTGLYNRNYLERLLQRDTETNDLNGKTLIGIDLSRLQTVTVTYGFRYTQDLIQRVVEALLTHCSDQRRLFQISEDRFVIYVSEKGPFETLTEFCQRVAVTLNHILSSERVKAGLGVVQIPSVKCPPIDILLRNLLITSERAAADTTNDIGICFYDDALEAQIHREQEIEQELLAVTVDQESSGLFLLYQPIMDLRSKRITALEALARLRTEKLGIVSPLEFIPKAEATKLIVPIGREIVRRAAEFLRALQIQGFPELHLTINVSVLELMQPDYRSDILEILNEEGVSPRNVVLEITESVLAVDFEEINGILGEFRHAGVKIAIDDFGTGYSSFAREQELNVDYLKVDKFFTDRILTLGPEKSIIGDIVSMGHKFGHQVITEGVEEQAQLEYLRQCGCDSIQGYLLSRPLAQGDVISFLRKHETNPNV